MNQIQKQTMKVNRSLDAISYFNALVKEGCRLSLLSPGQLETIQLQLLHVLADQFNLWTGGQSSSVTVETGQRIQQSVFYTLGYYLKSMHDTECALEALKNNALEAILKKGKQQIEEDRTAALKLLSLIQEKCLDTDISAYNDTLQEGLPLFFSAYDMDFEAHETPASIDYPLSNDKMNLTGIDYIYGYVRKLQLENEFCSYFSSEEIKGLLRGYDRQYKELLFNVYDLVLTNAIGCLLLGKNELRLHLSDNDRRYLQRDLSAHPAEKLDELVDEAVSRLLRMLFILKPQLVNYIKASTVNLKFRLKNALEVDGLKHLFLSAEAESTASAIRFEDNDPLDHDRFRTLADEIRACRFISDKLALLHHKPLSVADLIDLLEGDCFFGEEYQEVFFSLEELRLALLIKKLPLDPADSGFLDDESSKEWQSSFLFFLGNLEPLRRSSIFTLSDKIE